MLFSVAFGFSGLPALNFSLHLFYLLNEYLFSMCFNVPHILHSSCRHRRLILHIFFMLPAILFSLLF